MRIAMVSGHGCIRLHKMAIPLIERGHTVHLVAMKVCGFHNQYKTFAYCADVEQMLEALKLYEPHVDLYHCHNEPSWFVAAIKEFTDKPVVLDVHDSWLARKTEDEHVAALDRGENSLWVSTEERANFELADALVFPGEHFAELVKGVFKLEQPSLILPSYVPHRFYQYKTRDWHGGIVYEGLVQLPEECKGYATGMAYADYTQFAEATTKVGMDFHIYPTRMSDKVKKAYDQQHTFLHQPAPFEDLMAAMSRHDWGLVGNVTETPEWKVAFPNKLFEYLAAGLPVVAMHAEACGKFLEETGMGIAVSSVEELASRWAEHRQCRPNVYRQRRKWSMNANIEELEFFYQKTKRWRVEAEFAKNRMWREAVAAD